MSERDGLLDKVRALMAKTVENGCTEAEAMAALAKARAMIDAYEISDAELSLTKNEKAVLRHEPSDAKDPHNIKYWMISAVGKFTDCEAWRDAEKRLVFCGLRSDAQFATWLLDTLAAFVKAELVKHLMTSVAEGHERNRVIKSFVAGCTSRISARLRELCQQTATLQTSNARALVVVKNKAVADKLAELGITVRSTKIRLTLDPGAYSAGKAAGDRASFGRPVSGSHGTLRIESK